MNTAAIVFSLIVLSILAILFNSICLYIIKKSASLKNNPSTRLIVNLLSVHLFEGFLVFPFYTGRKLNPKDIFWARFFDNGFRFLYMLSFYGNCLGVLSISIDRFLAVFLMKNYRVKINAKRINCYLIGLWTYIIALCVIPFFNISYDHEFFPYEKVYKNGTHAIVKSKLYFYVHSDEWTVFMLCFNCALPFILIILSYIYIIKRLRSMEAKFTGSIRRKDEKEDDVELVSNKQKSDEVKIEKGEKSKDLLASKRITYITLTVVATYAICYVPSIIYFILEDICGKCFPGHYRYSATRRHVAYVVKYFAFLNAVATPIIYCFRQTEFTNALKKLRREMKCRPQMDDMSQASPTHTVETGLL